MAGKPNHDYHLVEPSPWPFLGSLSALVMAIGAVMYFTALKESETTAEAGIPFVLLVGLAGVLFTMYVWWADVIKEAHAGDHTRVVQLHMRYGMILFIASEVMFFVAWFWAYFDGFFYYNEAIQVARVEANGGVWPPESIELFDPWHLPLLNTIILLLSGTTCTWAHHALLHDDRKGLIWGLVLTVLLGLIFTACQAYEYSHAAFGFSGHLYSASFYMATGFHGFHVIVGTIFLLVCLLRALKGHFTKEQHFGFEAAAWYWHFVDVVWLFLFVCIYVWGYYAG